MKKKWKKKNKIKPQKVVKKENVIEKVEKKKSNFSDIVEQIIKRNSFKPFPDINDIPN